MVHSHPKFNAPFYSEFDKLVHKAFINTYSIFSYLNSLKTFFTSHFFQLSFAIGYFDYEHFLCILEALRASRSNDACVLGILSAIQTYLIACYGNSGVNPYKSPKRMNITHMFKDLLYMIEEFSKSFHLLKEKIALKLQKYRKKVKPIKFTLFPMIGMLICPDMRYVAVLESDYNIKDSTNWYFKKIHIT